MQKNAFNRSPSMVQITSKIEPPSSKDDTLPSTPISIVVFGGYQSGKSSLIQTIRAFLQSKLLPSDDANNLPVALDPQNPMGQFSSEWKEAFTLEGSRYSLSLRKMPELIELVNPSSNRSVDPSPSLLKQIKEADGFLGVYNVTDLASFKIMLLIHGFLLRIRQASRMPFVLVASYCDMVAHSVRPRQVTFESTKQLALEFGVPFFDAMPLGPQGDGVHSQVSALQVVSIFSELVSEIRGYQANPNHEASMLERIRDRSIRESRVDCSDLKFSQRFKDRNGNPEIRAGTLERLVERLTYHKYPSTDFMNTFLLTFRLFTTKIELLQLLEARYHLQPPPGLEGAELKGWTATFLMPVRMRVTNVLVHWLEDHFYDFDNDTEMTNRFQQFVHAIHQTSQSQGVRILKIYDKSLAGKFSSGNLVLPTKPPKPIVSKRITSGKPFTLLHIKPLELARQWALVDHQQLALIKPYEWCMSFWSGNQIGVNFVRQMITKFNIRVSWVCYEILQHPDPKERAKVLRHFISVGKHALAMNCYSALMAISAALESIPIHRLAKTWELVPKKYQEEYAMISKEICSPAGNYQTLRDRIESVSPPLVPYLGIYLSDLTFIQDGNPKMVDGLINFEKCRMLARTVEKLRTFQKSFYCFTEVRNISQWLTNIKPLADADTELYQLSLKREPRITEANVISRPTLPSQQKDAHQEMATRVKMLFETSALKTGQELIDTLNSWNARLLDPTPLFGGLSFLDCLLDCKAVEKLMLSVLRQHDLPGIETPLLNTFNYLLTGTPRMHRELWTAIRNLSPSLPSKIFAILSGALAVYKVQPVDEQEAQFWTIQHRIAELVRLLEVLEAKNEPTSVQTNSRKLRALSAIICLQKFSRECLKKLSANIMDAKGQFNVRKSADGQVLQMAEDTAHALVNTGQITPAVVQPVLDFLHMVKVHLHVVIEHIESLPKIWSMLIQESCDYLRSHLTILREQTSLFQQRLLHLHRLLTQESEADRVGLYDVAEELRLKLRVAFEADLYDLRRLMCEMDLIEPISEELRKDNPTAMTDCLRAILDIRSIYTNLEDEFPTLPTLNLKPDDLLQLSKLWDTKEVPVELLRSGRRSTLRSSISPDNLVNLMANKKVPISEYHGTGRRSVLLQKSTSVQLPNYAEADKLPKKKGGSMVAALKSAGIPRPVALGVPSLAPPATVLSPRLVEFSSSSSIDSSASSTNLSILPPPEILSSPSEEDTLHQSPAAMLLLAAAPQVETPELPVALAITNDSSDDELDDSVLTNVATADASSLDQDPLLQDATDDPLRESSTESQSSAEPLEDNSLGHSTHPSISSPQHEVKSSSSDDPKEKAPSHLISSEDAPKTGFFEELAPTEPPPSLPVDPATWSTEQVSVWLQSLGLTSSVMDAFHSNRLKGTDLLSLTADELTQDIGVDDPFVLTSILSSIDALRPVVPEESSSQDLSDSFSSPGSPSSSSPASPSHPTTGAESPKSTPVASRYTTFEKTKPHLRPKSITLRITRPLIAERDRGQSVLPSVVAPTGDPNLWSIDEMHRWVLSAGFAGVVAASFRSNEIAGKDALSLTDFELEVDLGVSDLSTRMRMLRMIRQTFQPVAAASILSSPEPELDDIINTATVSAMKAAEEEARVSQQAVTPAPVLTETKRVIKIFLDKEDRTLVAMGITNTFKAIVAEPSYTHADLLTALQSRLLRGLSDVQESLFHASFKDYRLYYHEMGQSIALPEEGLIWPIILDKSLNQFYLQHPSRVSSSSIGSSGSSSLSSQKKLIRVYLEVSQPILRNMDLAPTIKTIILEPSSNLESMLAQTYSRITRGMDRVRSDFVFRAISEMRLYYDVEAEGVPLADNETSLWERFANNSIPSTLYLRHPSLPSPAKAATPASAASLSPARAGSFIDLTKIEASKKMVLKIQLEQTDAVLRNLCIAGTAKAVFVEPTTTLDDLHAQLISRIVKGMTEAQSSLTKTAVSQHRLYYLKDDTAVPLSNHENLWASLESKEIPVNFVFRAPPIQARPIRPSSMILPHSSSFSPSPLGSPDRPSSGSFLASNSSPLIAPATPTLPPATPNLPPATPNLPPATPNLPPATPNLPPVTPHLPPATPNLPPVTPNLPSPTSVAVPVSPSSSSSSSSSYIQHSAVRSTTPTRRPQSVMLPSSPIRTASPAEGLSQPTSSTPEEVTSFEKAIIRVHFPPTTDEALIDVGLSNSRKSLAVEPSSTVASVHQDLIKNITKGVTPLQLFNLTSKLSNRRLFFARDGIYQPLSDGRISVFTQITSAAIPIEFVLLEGPRFFLAPSALPVPQWSSEDLHNWLLDNGCPSQAARAFLDQSLIGSDIDSLTEVELREDLEIQDVSTIKLIMDALRFLLNPTPPMPVQSFASPSSPQPNPLLASRSSPSLVRQNSIDSKPKDAKLTKRLSSFLRK